MKIKESKKLGFYFQNINKLKQAKILFVVGLIFIYSTLLILLGGVVHKEGVFGEVLIPALQQNVKVPFNYLKGFMSDPEQLIIDIKHKDYQRLAYKRKEALQKGVLHPFAEDYVNAKIRWNGKTTKVKLRLKGDLSDHWTRDFKWSLRVKTKGDGTILGMKNFSLQHPRTRGFFNDWVLHKMLKNEGLIALRYDFVDVVVNGKKLGIYAMEEHFEQKLLENNQRIDGPIIRIKDHLLWYLVDPKTGFTDDEIDELYTVSPIDAFTTSRINNDEALLRYFNTAKNLLEAFRRGKLKTSEVFDVDKLAKLFAVLDLFGYRHTTAYSNIRFYYNPFTSRLEPIGYDNTFIKDLRAIEGQNKKIISVTSDGKKRLHWKNTFFEDRIFFEKYMAAVSEVSKRKYLDDLFEESAGELNTMMSKVYSTFPAYSFDAEKNILYKNQQLIDTILNPLEGIQAYVKQIDRIDNRMNLEVGNNQFLPVLIKSVSVNGNVYPLSENMEILLQPKTPYNSIEFEDIEVSLPDDVSWLPGPGNEIKINYSLIGSPVVKAIAAFPWSNMDDRFLQDDVIRKKANVEEFDFISLSNATREINILPGSWKIDKNLIIPEGYTVICGPDTELDIVNASFMLSYSPLKFVGEKDSPIIISSSDQTGQGILVLKADGKSVFDNVVFESISSPVQSGLQLTGALTFYESDSELSGMTFRRSKSDIDLHIVRSKFAIDKSIFDRSKSTALNVIFSEGSISNTVFINSGDTALEVTGSRINAEVVAIKNAKKNGLLIKDRSKLRISDISVSGVQNAVISQDSSVVDLEGIAVNNCKNIFSALQTKSDYGPSIIRVTDFDENNIDGVYLIENKSTLMLDKKKYESYTKNVSDKLGKR